MHRAYGHVVSRLEQAIVIEMQDVPAGMFFFHNYLVWALVIVFCVVGNR